MVLEAEQFAAEAVIAQQRSADFTRFGVTALSHRFELEAWAHRQRGKHRIAVVLAAGLLASLLIAPVHAQSYPTQYLATVWQTEQGLPQNSVNAIVAGPRGLSLDRHIRGARALRWRAFQSFRRGGSAGSRQPGSPLCMKAAPECCGSAPDWRSRPAGSRRCHHIHRARRLAERIHQLDPRRCRREPLDQHLGGHSTF